MSDPQDGAEERARLDGLAQQMFPQQWAWANAKPTGRSRARRNLRQRVVGELKMRELRAAGCSCATCENFAPMPGPSSGNGKMICELGSDFHGYQIATADGLCTAWSKKS